MTNANGSAASAEESGKDAVIPLPNDGPLFLQYPVNSVLELTLAPGGETVRGLVYCTDEVSQSVVLKKTLVHTTIASEIRIINVACVKEKRIVQAVAPSESSLLDDSDQEVGEELALPLPNVNKKALEERERRAIRLAEERYRHINEKATPEGQEVFDRLVKACNEVAWRGDSILVSNQIKVEPPYRAENCKLLASNHGTLGEGSLDRVKKIVSTAPVKE